MMGKTHIFAKLSLTRICVQPTALALAKGFAQHRQLFFTIPETASLELPINAAMAVVVVCRFARVS